MIFGIIIDTFSSMRVDKLERVRDTLEICFICGINKQVFDRASDEPEGFKTHIKVDHNMWNYLYFIFMLWEQDKDDDDGLEQYVRRAIDANEISWFPLNKAIRLEQAATDEEITLREVSSELQSFEHALAQKISLFQSEMSQMLETVSQATKIEHAKGTVKDGIAGHLRRSLFVAPPTDDGADISDIGSSAILDTIEEDGLGMEDSMMEDGSTASGHGLGPVHEDSDEDSDFEEDGNLEHNTHTNSHTSSSVDLRNNNSNNNDNNDNSSHVHVHRESDVPDSQPAIFPGSVDEMEVDSMIGGPAVLIKERSNAFWDMEGVSVPSTPAAVSGHATTGGEGARPMTAVEVIPEEDMIDRDSFKEAGSSGLFPDISASREDVAPVEATAAGGRGEGGHQNEGESEGGVEMTEFGMRLSPWDAPATPATGLRPSTSQPEPESEYMRPDTAAPHVSVIDRPETANLYTDLSEGSVLSGGGYDGNGLGDNGDDDADQSEALPPMLEEPSDVVFDGEVEPRAQSDEHQALSHTDAVAEPSTETAAGINGTNSSNGDEDSLLLIPELDAAEGAADSTSQPSPSRHVGFSDEAPVVIARPELLDAAQREGEEDEEGELLPLQSSMETIEEGGQLEEEGNTEEEAQQNQHVQPADSESSSHVLVHNDSLGEAGEEGEEFEPEIQLPDEDHVEYLAGDSFRVTHVGDQDSLGGGASEFLESSLGGSPRIQEDWAREHQDNDDLGNAPPAATAVAQDSRSANVTVDEQLAEDDIPAARGLGDLGEESVLSALTAGSHVEDFAPVGVSARQQVTAVEQNTAEDAPTDLPVEQAEDSVRDEVNAAGENDEDEEDIDFDALEEEINR